jgi:hypothetical protein
MRFVRKLGNHYVWICDCGIVLLICTVSVGCAVETSLMIRALNSALMCLCLRFICLFLVIKRPMKNRVFEYVIGSVLRIHLILLFLLINLNYYYYYYWA